MKLIWKFTFITFFFLLTLNQSILATDCFDLSKLFHSKEIQIDEKDLIDLYLKRLYGSESGSDYTIGKMKNSDAVLAIDDFSPLVRKITYGEFYELYERNFSLKTFKRRLNSLGLDIKKFDLQSFVRSFVKEMSLVETDFVFNGPSYMRLEHKKKEFEAILLKKSGSKISYKAFLGQIKEIGGKKNWEENLISIGLVDGKTNIHRYKKSLKHRLNYNESEFEKDLKYEFWKNEGLPLKDDKKNKELSRRIVNELLGKVLSEDEFSTMVKKVFPTTWHYYVSGTSKLTKDKLIDLFMQLKKRPLSERDEFILLFQNYSGKYKSDKILDIQEELVGTRDGVAKILNKMKEVSGLDSFEDQLKYFGVIAKNETLRRHHKRIRLNRNFSYKSFEKAFALELKEHEKLPVDNFQENYLIAKEVAEQLLGKEVTNAFLYRYVDRIFPSQSFKFRENVNLKTSRQFLIDQLRKEKLDDLSVQERHEISKKVLHKYLGDSVLNLNRYYEVVKFLYPVNYYKFYQTGFLDREDVIDSLIFNAETVEDLFSEASNRIGRSLSERMKETLRNQLQNRYQKISGRSLSYLFDYRDLTKRSIINLKTYALKIKGDDTHRFSPKNFKFMSYLISNNAHFNGHRLENFDKAKKLYEACFSENITHSDLKNFLIGLYGKSDVNTVFSTKKVISKDQIALLKKEMAKSNLRRNKSENRYRVSRLILKRFGIFIDKRELDQILKFIYPEIVYNNYFRVELSFQEAYSYLKNEFKYNFFKENEVDSKRSIRFYLKSRFHIQLNSQQLDRLYVYIIKQVGEESLSKNAKLLNDESIKRKLISLGLPHKLNFKENFSEAKKVIQEYYPSKKSYKAVTDLLRELFQENLEYEKFLYQDKDVAVKYIVDLYEQTIRDNSIFEAKDSFGALKQSIQIILGEANEFSDNTVISYAVLGHINHLDIGVAEKAYWQAANKVIQGSSKKDISSYGIFDGRDYVREYDDEGFYNIIVEDFESNPENEMIKLEKNGADETSLQIDYAELIIEKLELAEGVESQIIRLMINEGHYSETEIASALEDEYSSRIVGLAYESLIKNEMFLKLITSMGQ
ncbi:hypothetical protein HBN50_03715 [Halobacteriovorax sp. GB3]|uniref:hypothetical protein n=1 Tax=Halobacteriovorax sp. GB3 TaxID=2719615 RepID=UPI00235EA2AB|nr:hypothetical protein [Halobacteriovorax sp. GB3]MDD0852186.1 hypothetical protein [Halobacteriovorax sp. GB3]